MSKSIKEIGINIFRVKMGGAYYQVTCQYTFHPSILHASSKQISFLRISEEEAQLVIEMLNLKMRQTESFTKWACKQEIKYDDYRIKSHRKLQESMHGVDLASNS